MKGELLALELSESRYFADQEFENETHCNIYLFHFFSLLSDQYIYILYVNMLRFHLTPPRFNFSALEFQCSLKINASWLLLNFYIKLKA